MRNIMQMNDDLSAKSRAKKRGAHAPPRFKALYRGC
jgi:hypothetical protein